jgi:hypothetical protein
MAGCGSSASTSHEEAREVAVAEQEFLTAWGQANGDAKDRCEAKTSSDAAFTHCFAATAMPAERRAVARYTQTFEKVLAAGVGSECAEALEESVAESVGLAAFGGGDATRICRTESRGG